MIKEEECDLESEIKVEDEEIQLEEDSIQEKKTDSGKTIEIKEEVSLPIMPKLLNLSCFHCNKFFKHESSLRGHIWRSHPGFPLKYSGGPIKCKMCPEVCDGVKSLQKHYDKNHPDRASAIKYKYKCGYCSRKFFRKKYLKIHITKHLKNPQFKCKSCSATFSTRNILSSHEKIHKNAIYSCDFCGKNFIYIIVLKKHQRKSHGITDHVLKCDICSMKYESNNENDFEKHLLKHPEKYPFLCTICLETFQTKKKLKSHFQEKETCLKELEKARANAKTSRGLRNAKSLKVYQCAECGKMLKTLSNLKYHMVKHTTKRYTCEICSKSFKLEGHLLRHMSRNIHINSERYYKCHWCKEVFGKQSELTEHATSAHNEKLFYCLICYKTFRMKNHLRCHMTTHSKRRFECQICKGKENEQVSEPMPKLISFKTKGNLHQHMAKWHTEKASVCFTCSICSKAFGTKWILANHMFVHTDEKTFECDKCPKKYKKLAELKLHKKRHDEKEKKDATIEKPYKCNVCERRFKTFNEIFRHSQTHNDSQFNCEKCPKTFISDLELRQHVKDFHSKKCPVCAKIFSAKKLLNTHMKIHNPPEEKCFICSRSFKIKATLMRHLTQVHKMSKADAERSFNVKTSPPESPVQVRDEEQKEEILESVVVKEEYELN